MELRPGLIVAERFRLVRPLGQGGMGAVWLGQHIGLDVPCAVKFIHENAAQSPDLRARFEREAKAAAQLRSPNVVQIIDYGMWQGSPYIAMELLEGEDLEHRLRRRGALPVRETLSLVTQVGRALSKAHTASLVHRDLKPGNIFIVRDEEREIAKVLDFGVAKVSEPGIDGSTRTGAVLGTPYYMSPEQARGIKAVDHRSDLWALAVVTYQCLTGQLPFMGTALGDLFMKIIAEPLPIPSRVAPVPPAFDGWWARAAARDPAHRFQTARELSDALGLALGVTVSDGVEVGSSMAIRGIAAPGSATQMPASGSVPTPMQQAISIHAGSPPARGAAVIAGVVAVLVLAGGGAVFALRASKQVPALPVGAASMVTISPVPASAASAVPTATAVVLHATAPSASVSAPVASATVVAAHASDPPVKPAHDGASDSDPRPKPRAPAVPVGPAKPATAGAPKDTLGF